RHSDAHGIREADHILGQEPTMAGPVELHDGVAGVAVGVGARPPQITPNQTTRDSPLKVALLVEHRIGRITPLHDLRVAYCYVCVRRSDDVYAALREVQPGDSEIIRPGAGATLLDRVHRGSLVHVRLRNLADRTCLANDGLRWEWQLCQVPERRRGTEGRRVVDDYRRARGRVRNHSNLRKQ